MALGERLSSAAKILFEGTAIERAFKALDAEGKISIQGYPNRPRHFDLDNGAVYLGALARRSRLKKTVDAFDYRDADGAYSDTGVLAVIQQAALRKREGQRIKVILVGGLREVCSDGEAPILSFDEQKDRTVALSRTHLDLAEEDFEFVNMVDEHAELFARLTDVKYPLAYDPAPISVKNASPLDAVFAEPPSPNAWSSYRIAYDLYQAVKADPSFAQVFKGLMPEGLPEEEDESGFSFLAGYSLFETAIHLADVIKGRPCQIGVGRQAKYNEVVIELMKGKKGSWKGLKVLHPLFERVKSETFLGVNVAKNPNPVTSSIRRSRARLRLGAGLGGAATLVGLGALLGEKMAQDRFEDLDVIYAPQMADIVQGQSCRGEDSWMGTLDEDEKARRLKSRLGEIREVLKIRYDIEYSDSDWHEEGVSDFLDFLSQDIGGVGYDGLCDFLLTFDQYAVDMTDRYVATKKASFKRRGADTSRPFAYLGELNFQTPETVVTICTSDINPTFSSTYLGQFSSFDSIYRPVDLYEVREFGRTFLATRNDADCFTTEKIPEIAEDYAFTLRRWAALPYRYHQANSYQEPNKDVPSELDESDLSHPFPPFVDPMGQFEYDLALYGDYTRVGFTEYYLVAKRKGEEKFSKEAAHEFLDIKDELEMPWHHNSTNYPKFVQTKP